jgi:hypothetical protein
VGELQVASRRGNTKRRKNAWEITANLSMEKQTNHQYVQGRKDKKSRCIEIGAMKY